MRRIALLLSAHHENLRRDTMSRFFALVSLVAGLSAVACSDAASLSGLDDRDGQATLQEGTDTGSNNGQCGGCKP